MPAALVLHLSISRTSSACSCRRAELWKASLQRSETEQLREREREAEWVSSGELIIHMNWAMLELPLLKQLCHAKCLCYLFKFPLCTPSLTSAHTRTHTPSCNHIQQYKKIFSCDFQSQVCVCHTANYLWAGARARQAYGEQKVMPYARI